MGQRSQIYVRFNNRYGKTELVARYFNWNFGERMGEAGRFGGDPGERPEGYS